MKLARELLSWAVAWKHTKALLLFSFKPRLVLLWMNMFPIPAASRAHSGSPPPAVGYPGWIQLDSWWQKVQMPGHSEPLLRPEGTQKTARKSFPVELCTSRSNGKRTILMSRNICNCEGRAGRNLELLWRRGGGDGGTIFSKAAHLV